MGDSSESGTTKTLGLSMIVKNEAGIILNCLKSIAPYLDYWVIHDTGSTDGTPEIIEDFFREQGISGELHHTPWKNFSYNRNQALMQAKKKTDYVLLLDADFVVHVKNPQFKSKLKSPGYLIRYDGGLDYRQILLIEAKHNWTYYGVTHEYIDTKPQMPVEITEFISIEHTGEGSNRTEKFRRDVELLLQGIKDEPNNARYYFYLAQSYKDWEKYDEAIKYYKKRAEFPNWDEEVFYSYYQIAMCKKRRGDDFYDYVGDYLRAFKARPHRIEPLYQILDSSGNDPELADIGYQLGKLNDKLDYPTFDLLFIEKPLYDWMYLDMLATAAHSAGKYPEALEITERLLREDSLPNHQRGRFDQNLKWLRSTVSRSSSSTLRPGIFRFQRISPDIKENRVAIIIPNYNMIERTNNIVNSIMNSSKHPTDIIVVDNGSDQVAPSVFTVVSLTKNVQTTNAWLNGLHYADSLEITEGFKYAAYVFAITSGEIIQTGLDPIKQLYTVLESNENAVGVHPALTIDSTTFWKQLIYQYPPKIRQTNMIDNIFSMYRAEWFNSIGRFDPNQTFAWGIDVETSYLARKQEKVLAVNDNVLIRKISDIGYTLDRMGMSADERFSKASKQMKEVFVKKYGPNYGVEFDTNIIRETIASDITDEKYLKEYYSLMLNFEKMEGAHQLLIEYLYRNHHNYYGKKGLRLLEIGQTRDGYPHLDSTKKLSLTCKVYGYEMISVDVDPNIVRSNQRRLMSENPKLRLVCKKAEEYLKNAPEFHFVYLDGFDFVSSSDNIDPERVAKYQENLGMKLTNENCAQMHLDCVRLLVPRMPVGGIICISSKEYKGRTAVPYLLQNGFVTLRTEDSGILLQKQREAQQEITTVARNIDPKSKYIVTLLGYKSEKNRHTNWFPWYRFSEVFTKLGYQVEWVEKSQLHEKRSSSNLKKRIFICWNEPTSLELIREGLVGKDDIIFQKLTSLGKGMNDINWGDDPEGYFKNWNWPLYHTVEELYDRGFNIYGFGCHTNTDKFPEKHRICEKLKKAGRLFWINWGTTVYNQEELSNCKPVMDDFEYDVGYIGSKWGVAGRGNTDVWDKFMQPIVDKYPENSALFGSGLGGMPDNKRTAEILKKSKLCPIIHAPSWVAERGVQDRFYTVFASGRFGVCDNEGVYDFFNHDEVVVETDPEKYVEKSLYYLENVKEQQPFIEKVQHKLKTKYNWYIEWEDILDNVISQQQDVIGDEFEYLTKVNKISEYNRPFFREGGIM